MSRQVVICTLALSLGLTLGPALAQECTPIKLNQPLPDGREVLGFGIVPDASSRVAYLANIDDEDFYDLYTVPASGATPPVLFDVGLGGDNGVAGLPEFALSQAVVGSLAVYRADGEVDGVIELYSIPTTDGGGVPTKLNGNLVENGDVSEEFLITEDATTVVYLAEELALREELYRVPATGGTSVRVNAPLKAGDVEGDFRVSSDGQYVVFRAQQDTADVVELYSASLSGGQPVKLNGDLVEGTEVLDFVLSPDGSTVVYRAEQDTEDLVELYRVPIGGGSPQRVNGPEVEVDVTDYGISPDGQFVAYTFFTRSPFVKEVYSAPIGGGTPVELSLNEGTVNRFFFSPDSQTVLIEWRNEQNPSRYREIGVAPIAGGSLTTITGDLTDTDGGAFLLAQSADSKRMVFRVDMDQSSFNHRRELRSVTLDGESEPVKIAGPLQDNGFLGKVIISPDSRTVIFHAELDSEFQSELYSTSIFGGGPVNKLNGPLVAGGEVGNQFSDFELTADTRFAAYIADQDTFGIDEVFSTDITCGIIFFDYFESVVPPS